MEDYARQRAEWRTLVGTVILSFGDIELITLRCLAHLPTYNIYESVSTLPFGRRVDLIIEILQGWANTHNAVTTLMEKLKRAKALSEYRNVLAHNPLVADIYIHQITDDVIVEHSISARKKEKSIDITSLKKLAGEVEGLALELYMTLEKVIKEIDRSE
ncbi:MAG: hypothetical protein HYV59_14985 [Planctomycetes bacterium]|nr:hypothetical protein [Planctomycetota bacterium]